MTKSIEVGAPAELLLHTRQQLQVGVEAPDFALTDLTGAPWRLSGQRGRVVALLFYPGNETLVCTRQLCSVRERWAEYVATGAEIVGLSPCQPDEQQLFAARHSLPLRMLADQTAEVTKLYSRHWCMPSWASRTIVIVDAQGLIRCRKVMLRAFRPSDDEVLTQISLAQYDILAARRSKT